MEVSVLSECGSRGNGSLIYNVLIAATLITASEWMLWVLRTHQLLVTLPKWRNGRTPLLTLAPGLWKKLNTLANPEWHPKPTFSTAVTCLNSKPPSVFHMKESAPLGLLGSAFVPVSRLRCLDQEDMHRSASSSGGGLLCEVLFLSAHTPISFPSKLRSSFFYSFSSPQKACPLFSSHHSHFTFFISIACLIYQKNDTLICCSKYILYVL